MMRYMVFRTGQPVTRKEIDGWGKQVGDSGRGSLRLIKESITQVAHGRWSGVEWVAALSAQAVEHVMA
jgi:hypothetical protein